MISQCKFRVPPLKVEINNGNWEVSKITKWQRHWFVNQLRTMNQLRTTTPPLSTGISCSFLGREWLIVFTYEITLGFIVSLIFF